MTVTGTTEEFFTTENCVLGFKISVFPQTTTMHDFPSILDFHSPKQEAQGPEGRKISTTTGYGRSCCVQQCIIYNLTGLSQDGRKVSTSGQNKFSVQQHRRSIPDHAIHTVRLEDRYMPGGS